MNDNRVISVGIFFDGTGNNGVNALSAEKPLNNNESYFGTLTNIYKLYSLFNGNKKIYIEGIGTAIGCEDSNFAMATCANPPYGTGYSSDDKLQKADCFVEEMMSEENKEYHFYIYGFGRGGMLARTFCNQLLSYYALKNCKIKFLGAFDTVESKPFNKYNLNLHHQIENAFHICAVNESRFFFPLTGFFEDSKMMRDQKVGDYSYSWKEIFVPGAHADIGGGYLEGPQSVYISTDFVNIDDLRDYVSDIRNAKTNTEGTEIWNALLAGYQIEKGENLSQAYVSRDIVYNDLSKVYGKLMMAETNRISCVFDSSDDAYFKINYNKHFFLEGFSKELNEYAKDISAPMKPLYNFGRLNDYIHISASFGLYSGDFDSRSEHEINAELINNGLNVSSSTTVKQDGQARLSVELHLPEDSFVADFLYGTSVPNNDIWIRTILKSPAPARVNEIND
ncbi:phospholipase effector Tle1 domain-containing protein [Chryseobacterium sp. Mn2064]|uniref:phospholipase effector Tle1 domain-containing protein n=1 Tax=Chryseobacterium sp. Mn2064 TaxID=3395263 RepID=UPI003BC517AD